VWVPAAEQEDARRDSRERERLIAADRATATRSKRCCGSSAWRSAIRAAATGWSGFRRSGLARRWGAPPIMAELAREHGRLVLVVRQLAAPEGASGRDAGDYGRSGGDNRAVQPSVRRNGAGRACRRRPPTRVEGEERLAAFGPPCARRGANCVRAPQTPYCNDGLRVRPLDAGDKIRFPSRLQKMTPS
jgi:hypothetical protein